MKIINWKKGVFSSRYQLYSNNGVIGEFRASPLSSTSIGELEGNKLKFKKKGIFTSDADIIDLNLNKIIGEIRFNIWRSNAEIELNGRIYHWKFDNIWNSKWGISEKGRRLINYKSSTTSGYVEFLIDNNLLILTGFNVSSYYTIRLVIFVLIIINLF